MFEQDSQGVTSILNSGQTERGDALIGADGIWSTVRAQLLGETQPRYAGYLA
jgi:3-hydroxybenzoate 6-monooxygenase